MKEEIDILIEQYKIKSIAHGETLKTGDHKKANKLYEQIVKLISDIQSFGNDGNEALFELIFHENDSIKCWSAAYSLKYKPEQSERVLQELSKLMTPIALTAEIILDEWKNGNS